MKLIPRENTQSLEIALLLFSLSNFRKLFVDFVKIILIKYGKLTSRVVNLTTY